MHPSCSLELRPQLPFGSFSGLVCCGETEATSQSSFLPYPTAQEPQVARYRRTQPSAPPSARVLAPLSVPAHAPPLFNSLTFSSLPPTTPLPQDTLTAYPPSSCFLAAVGIQMRLESLQRTFWAATQQVGVTVAGPWQGRRPRHLHGEEGLVLSDPLPPALPSGPLLGPLSALRLAQLPCLCQRPSLVPAFPTQRSLKLDPRQRTGHRVPFGTGLPFTTCLILRSPLIAAPLSPSSQDPAVHGLPTRR